MLNGTRSGRMRRSRAVTTLGSVVAAITLILTAAGCSATNPSGGGGAHGGPPVSDPEAALMKFNECMREHGVDISDDEGEGVARARGTEDPNVDDAADACRKLRPAGVSFASGDDPGQQLSEAQMEALLAYASCMRAHGQSVPDPDPDGGGLVMPRDEGIDLQSEEFQEAHQACESKLSGLPSPEEGQ